MRVLVTGGSASSARTWSTSCSRAARAGDLRPQRLALPLAREVDTFTGRITDPAARARAARLRRGGPPGGGGGRQRRPRRAGGRRAGQRPRTVTVLEAARRRRVSGSSTPPRSGSTATARREVDEDTLLPAPSHLYTAPSSPASSTAPTRSSTGSSTRSALRDPIRAAGARAGVVAAFVELAFAGEPLTLAGDGSQSRSFVYVEDLADGIVAALTPTPPTASTTSPATRTSRSSRSPRRCGQHRRLRDRLHAGAARRLRRQGRSPTSAPEELGWTAATSSTRASAGTSSGSRAGPRLRTRSRQAAVGEWEGPRRRRAARTPRSPRAPARVLILSADIGEGHDLPARTSRPRSTRRARTRGRDRQRPRRDGPDLHPVLRDGPGSPSAGCRGCSTSSTGCS